MTKTDASDNALGLSFTKLKESYRAFRRQVSKRVLLLEFGNGFVKIAEARFKKSKIVFGHFKYIPLPQEATERGLPTNPKLMAGLIKEIITEENNDVN